MRMLSRLLVASILLVAAGCVGDHAQHKARGNVMFHNGDIPGAIKEYRAAIAATPKDANSHALLGNALFEQGQFAEAAEAYAAALAIDPKLREARRGQATVIMKTGKAVDARARFEALVADSPQDPEMQAALGKLLLAQGDLDGAESHLREALRWAQNDPSALYALGLTLAKKRQQAQALEVFDRLEAATPEKAYAPYGRAVTLASVGRKDEAFTWLQRALERGVTDLDGVASDPALSPLADDPRLASLVAEARKRAPPKKGAP